MLSEVDKFPSGGKARLTVGPPDAATMGKRSKMKHTADRYFGGYFDVITSMIINYLLIINEFNIYQKCLNIVFFFKILAG
jgi:hypothetical protein